MIYFLDFVPGKAGGVFDRLLKTWLRLTARDNVKPIAVAAVFGDAALVGSEKHGPGHGADAFDFDEAKLAGVEIEARDVVAEILLVNIINLATPCSFVVHYELHRSIFNFRVGLQTTNLRLGAFGMRQHQNARHPLDRLKR